MNSVPIYAQQPLEDNWPEQVLSECYKYNECIATLGQFDCSRPDWFLSKELPHYRKDGHVYDYTCKERQDRYLSRLHPEGVAHEKKLIAKGPVKETPWGIIPQRDGLTLTTLAHVREYQMRKEEWRLFVTEHDMFSGMFVNDLVRTTHSIIMEEQSNFRANRNEPVIRRIADINRRALQESGERMGALLANAYDKGGTLEEIWSRV